MAAQTARVAPTLKLSEHLERYRLVLKQLDISQQALFDLGFMTAADQRKIQNFIDDEKERVMRALKAFGLYADGSTPAPTGIPSLDAARKVGSNGQ